MDLPTSARARRRSNLDASGVRLVRRGAVVCASEGFAANHHPAVVRSVRLGRCVLVVPDLFGDALKVSVPCSSVRVVPA